ncbi:MAG: hypothetical protein Q9167_002565 [Letrouitia subvulpina]
MRDQANSPDFIKLCNIVSPSLSNLKLQHRGQDVLPLTVSELEVLFALCKAAPSLADVTIARSLLNQLGPYLLNTHVQAIAISPFVRSIEPSLWELLSFSLAYAIIALGLKHPPLHLQVFECTCHYLQKCLEVIKAAPVGGLADESEDLVKTIGIDQAVKTAALSTSLLGFLDAASRLTHFFSVSERLHLVDLLRNILTEQFMVIVEGVFSSMRTANTPSNDILLWRYFSRRYAASGRPLGAMLLQQGFLKLLVSCSSLDVVDKESLQRSDTLDVLLLQQQSLDIRQSHQSIALLELLADIAVDEMHLLEDGADYLRLASSWQQRLAFSVKAHTLITYLNCMIANEEIAEADILVPWLEETIADAVQMSHEELASVTLRSMAIVSRFSPSFATSFSRLLPRFIVQSTVNGETIDAAARSLASILQLLSQDAVITGLYSLGNVLSNSNTDHAVGVLGKDSLLNPPRNAGRYHPHANGSAISLDVKCDDDAAAAYGNIVRAIVAVANSCDDDKITALALSILLQKLGRVNITVDNYIIREAARLVVRGGPVELKSLLKLYGRISHDCVVQRNLIMLEAVKRARIFLAKNLNDATLMEEYRKNLLETIVSKGDVHESDNTHEADVELAGREITELLAPLAVSVSCQRPFPDGEAHEDILRLQREAWFNIVVHGITPYASIDQQFISALRSIAVNTKPLIAHDRADQYESEIELNTVLRRGMNPPHTAEQKKRLISLLPKCESEIRSLSYPKLMFLHAAYVVEILRAEAGDCTKVLSYFLDPSLNNSAMGNCMVAISDEVMKTSLRCQREFPSTVAEQLAQILTGCCHRIRRVQVVAFSCAEKLIYAMPSCLCQRKSLFALLELLSMMWTSCLDCEIDEYDWKSGYFSERGKVSIELSDDFELRKSTLSYFYKRAKEWVTSVINIAPLDVKGLLQVQRRTVLE